MSDALAFNRSGADLSFVRDGSVTLIFTGPPFFDGETEMYLRQPREQQRHLAEVEGRLRCFAESLRPVFSEMCRVLNPDGTIVLHTKDIRYGNSLVPLAHWHEEFLRSEGFSPLTKIHWLPDRRPRRSGRSNSVAPAVGDYRARELELFSVFQRVARPTRRPKRPAVAHGACWLDEPVWVTEEEVRADRHRHASPPVVLRRILELYSLPGDLVLDPFCGGGGFLEVAREMGRNAVGTEISPVEFDRCIRRLLAEVK